MAQESNSLSEHLGPLNFYRQKKNQRKEKRTIQSKEE